MDITSCSVMYCQGNVMHTSQWSCRRSAGWIIIIIIKKRGSKSEYCKMKVIHILINDVSKTEHYKFNEHSKELLCYMLWGHFVHFVSPLSLTESALVATVLAVQQKSPLKTFEHTFFVTKNQNSAIISWSFTSKLQHFPISLKLMSKKGR